MLTTTASPPIIHVLVINNLLFNLWFQMVEEGHQSMYVFEGTDYSKEPSSADQKAFDELIEGIYI